MLQFVYEFLYKFIDKKDFNILYTDTDSLYSGFTSDKLEDIIKPELKSYMKKKKLWFRRKDTLENAAYDNRTAGLLKTEFIGDGMNCLSCKLYYCLGELNKSNKFSYKGVQKRIIRIY